MENIPTKQRTVFAREEKYFDTNDRCCSKTEHTNAQCPSPLQLENKSIGVECMRHRQFTVRCLI